MKYLGGKHGIGKKIALFISQKCPNNSVNGYIPRYHLFPVIFVMVWCYLNYYEPIFYLLGC
jgi:hypothetical protein